MYRGVHAVFAVCEGTFFFLLKFFGFIQSGFDHAITDIMNIHGLSSSSNFSVDVYFHNEVLIAMRLWILSPVGTLCCFMFC